MVGYLDDLLIIGKCKEGTERAFQLTKKQLESLGFVVNMEKSFQPRESNIWGSS